MEIFGTDVPRAIFYLFMRADVVGYDTNITRNSEGQPLPYCINLLTSLVIEEHMK